MLKIKVNEIVLCLLVVLSVCNSSFLKTFDNDLTAAATEMPSIEFTLTPDLPSTEITTEEISTETPEEAEPTHFIDQPVEDVLSHETQPAETHNGSLFRLMMTVYTKWNDDFMEKTSVTFNKLATELGGELIDFIDNSYELAEMNVTVFKLVEVRPSKDSLEKVYVTFIVSSKKEFKSENLRNLISNRIISQGGIYEYKVTIESFVLESISREEAQDYEDIKVACDLGKLR